MRLRQDRLAFLCKKTVGKKIFSGKYAKLPPSFHLIAIYSPDETIKNRHGKKYLCLLLENEYNNV